MQLDRQLLLDLASEYGTPLYVYNGDLIHQRYTELKNFITWPKFTALYAMKANCNPAILKSLNEIGASLDTVSPAEVLMAKELGFSADRMLPKPTPAVRSACVSTRMSLMAAMPKL